jgi:hypothetical protein
MEGFNMQLRMRRQLRETNSCIDVIAQQLFSERNFAG